MARCHQRMLYLRKNNLITPFCTRYKSSPLLHGPHCLVSCSRNKEMNSDRPQRDATSAATAPHVSISNASTDTVTSLQPDPWRHQSPALNPDSTVSTTDLQLPASSFPSCDVTPMSQLPVAQQTVDRTGSVTNDDTTEPVAKDKSWTLPTVKIGCGDANPSALSAMYDGQCRPRQLWNPFLQSAPSTTIVAEQDHDIDDRKNNNGLDVGVRDPSHAMKHHRDEFDELDAAAQKACKKRKLASMCNGQQQQPHAPAAGSERQKTPHDVDEAAAEQQSSTSSDGFATASFRQFQQQRGQSPSSSTVDASQPTRLDGATDKDRKFRRRHAGACCHCR
jgi:hypothetical protein